MRTILFPKMYRKLLLFFIFAFILLIVLISTNILTVFTSYFHNVSDGNKQSINVNKLRHYGAIIDAGSSGSRLFLYTWPTHSGNGDELLDIKPLLDSRGIPISKKVTPGLSNFADKPDEVISYIKQLFNVAAAGIPTSQHKETPLYVMATAGMRMISKEAQTNILDNIRKVAKKDYNFLFSDSHAKVITGREEGIYGWITTNFLLGRFNHNHTDNVPIISVPYGDSPLRSQTVHHRKRTVGVIDMGGGSMQIAYELSADQSKKTASAVVVNLGCKDSDIDHTYKLFVTTFLGFGANTARTRFERLLVQETLSSVNTNTTLSYQNKSPWSKNLMIDDPCLHPGLELSSSVRVVNDSQGGLNLSSKQLQRLPSINATFHGTGKYAECTTRVASLLDKQGCSNNTDKSIRCTMAGRLHPAVDLSKEQFYGFSEFWYSTNDVYELGGLYNYFKLNSRALEHCRENWFSVILKQKKGVYRRADWPRLRYQCFKSAWITTVLHEGLGFPVTYNKFTSVMEINGAEVQWSLGALLYQTRYFPLRVIEEKERMRRRQLLLRRERSPGDVTYLVVVAVAVVVALVLYMHRGPRRARTGGKPSSSGNDSYYRYGSTATLLTLGSPDTGGDKYGSATRDCKEWA